MKKERLSGGFFIYLLAGFSFCMAVYYAFLGAVDPDEVEAVHTAWKMLSGEALYRDFFQHHHPLFYYSLIPLIKFGGESIVTFYLAEAFAFLIFAAIVVTTFFLAEKVYGDRKTSWLAVILLLAFPFFIVKGTEIRPDPLQVLLGLLAVYFLADALQGGLKEGARKRLVLSALLLSLSFLVLQKAVFLIFVVGLVLLSCLLSGLFRGETKITPKITNGDFFLYWAVFSALPALYAVFLLATGGWQNYFDFNWLLNIKLQTSFSPLKHFSKFRTGLIMATFVLLFMYGFGRSFKPGGTGGTDKTGDGDLHRLVALTGGILAASVFLVRAPFTQYFLAMAPFVSMVAAFSLRRLFSNTAAKAWLVVLVLLSSYALVRGVGDGAWKKRGSISSLQYVLSVSGSEDLHFGFRNNLFRKDASFFWFCMEVGKCTDTYSSFRDYDFDPVRVIKETRPKVISVPRPNKGKGFYESIVEQPEVASDYEQSPGRSDVYIRKDRR